MLLVLPLAQGLHLDSNSPGHVRHRFLNAAGLTKCRSQDSPYHVALMRDSLRAPGMFEPWSCATVREERPHGRSCKLWEPQMLLCKWNMVTHAPSCT